MEEEKENPDMIQDKGIFDMFINNFDVFNSFLKSGRKLKNENITLKYSNYIIIDLHDYASREYSIYQFRY